MSAERGAAPETKKRMRPPVRACSFANTSRSAIFFLRARPPGIGTHPSESAPHCSPAAFAQKTILRLIALPDSAFSTTRAYPFSYSRGTDNTTVGFTSPRFAATVANDPAELLMRAEEQT